MPSKKKSQDTVEVDEQLQQIIARVSKTVPGMPEEMILQLFTAASNPVDLNHLSNVHFASLAIYSRLINEGQASEKELREGLSWLDLRLAEKGFAVLKRTRRITRVPNSKTAQYEVADPRFSVMQLVGDFLAPKGERFYSQPIEVRGTLRFTTMVVAGFFPPGAEPTNGGKVDGKPEADADEGTTGFLVFERDVNGDVWFPDKHFRGMLKGAISLSMNGLSLAVVDRIALMGSMTVSADAVKSQRFPVPGGQGKRGRGVTVAETLPAGTEVSFAARTPASHVSPEQLREVVEFGGRCVGFSPAKRRDGYGRFELVKFEVMQPSGG